MLFNLAIICLSALVQKLRVKGMVISWISSVGLPIVNIVDFYIRSPLVQFFLCRKIINYVFSGLGEFKVIHVSESEPLAVGTYYGKDIQV